MDRCKHAIAFGRARKRARVNLGRRARARTLELPPSAVCSSRVSTEPRYGTKVFFFGLEAFSASAVITCARNVDGTHGRTDGRTV
jgi:hypothetical protein